MGTNPEKTVRLLTFIKEILNRKTSYFLQWQLFPLENLFNDLSPRHVIATHLD